jgi:hypothetical protein
MIWDWLRALLSGENRMIRLQRETLAALRIVHGQTTRIGDKMATQEDVDALKATVDQLGGTLGTALAGIQSDLDALKAANPGVDISALQASVSNLATAVDQATAIDAENPVPPTV